MGLRETRGFFRPSHHGLLCAFIALLFPLCFCLEAGAQEKYELTVDPAFGRVYPADRFLPLRVTLANHSDGAVEGSVIIPVLQGPAPTEFHVPVAVPPRAQFSLNAYVYLPQKPLSNANGARAVPVANVEWRSNSGARLALSQILAQPDTATDAQANRAAGSSGYLFLIAGERNESESRDSFLTEGLMKVLSGQVSYPLNIGTSSQAALPRDRAGYGAVRTVVFNSLPPDSLDACQREALLQYLLAGGNLVLAAPPGDADPTGTWLEQYLPVHIVGRRMADRIAMVPGTTDSAESKSSIEALKFREFVDVCEAADAGGETLIGDANYVHAAFKRVGLGRVVFTSFPINALDPADPRTAALWTTLLDLNGPTHDWTSSALSEQRDAILGSMVGTPVPPWSRAAIVVSSYVVLSLFVQLGFRGARSSRGIGVLLVIAVGLSGALFAMAGAGRKSHSDISMARLATIELGPTGGGVEQDAMVFIGREDPDFGLRTDEAAILRPAVASSDNPAAVEQLPFQARNAGVRAGRVERVWQGSKAVGAGYALVTTLQFTPDGARATFDNRIGQPVASPLLLAGRGGSYRLGNIPSGTSSVLLGARNPKDDFTNVSLITGEDATLRARIIQAVRTPRSDAPQGQTRNDGPEIAGWLDASASDLAGPIVQCTAYTASMNARILITSPVTVTPSLPDQVVRVPSDFVALAGPAVHGTLFDPATNEWVESVTESSWLLGIQLPPGIGPCKPLRALISVDLAAPKHSIILRRGQCVQGAPQDNPDGAVGAQWSQVTGLRQATIDLDTNDVDRTNCIWLRLSVERSDTSSGEIQPHWKFNAFSADVEVRTESKR
jgi:hypothetical protein